MKTAELVVKGREASVLEHAQQHERLLEVPDLLCLAALIAALLSASVVLSLKKTLWADEIITLRIVTTASWSAMWRAITDVFGHMPLYFIVARIWTWFFGAGQTALRLLSSLSFCAGFLLLWVTLRRYFRWRAVAIGTGALVAFSPILLDQNAEIRFYGLFFLLVAGAVHLADRVARADPATDRLLVVNTLVQIALVFTHIFGVLFCGLMLLAFVVADRFERRFRPSLYAAYVVGIASFAFWAGPLARQRAVMDPHSPFEPPQLHELSMMAFVDLSLVYPTLLAVLAFAALGWLASGRACRATAMISAARRASRLVIVAGAFLAAPLILWIASRVATPVFLPRYLLPTIIGYCILLTLAAEAVLPPSSASAAGRVRWTRRAVDLAILLLFFVPTAQAQRQLGRPALGAEDDRFGHAELPIVVENGYSYHSRFFNGPHPTRYVYLVDREAALARGNDRHAAPDDKLLAAIKAHFPDFTVEPYDDFLARRSRFLVVDAPTNLWSEYRLLDDPAYKVTLLGRIKDSPLDESMLLVERIDAVPQR